MATGTIQNPEVRSVYFNDTYSFDDLLQLPSGLYMLRISSKTTGRPAVGAYWFVIQIHLDTYVMQLTKNTASDVLYMRTITGSGTGAWKSVTFS